MKFNYLVGEFYLERINVGDFLSNKSDLIIDVVTVSIQTVKASLSIQSEIPYIGEVVYFKQSLQNLGSVQIKNGAHSIDIKGEMSYVSFFQLAHTFHNYGHISDSYALFNIKQDKYISYRKTKVNGPKCYAKLEDVFFKKDIHVYRGALIGDINIVKNDLFEKRENLFKQINIYNLSPFKFMSFSKIKWKDFLIEDFKMKAPIIVDHLLCSQPCILEWEPSYKTDFTTGSKDEIKGIKYKGELTIFNYNIKGSLYVATFNHTSSISIKSAIYGEYRLIEKVFFVGGLEMGPIKVAMVRKDIEVNNYEIVDFESELFILFDYKFNRNVFVTIKDTNYFLGNFIGLKNVQIKSVKAKFSITTPVKVDKINSIVEPLAEIYLIIKREFINIKGSIYLFANVVSYTHFIFKKDGSYREILFNKSYSFNIHKPEYPSKTFVDIGLSDWKYYPIDFKSLNIDSYLMKDTKTISLMVDVPVKSIEPFSCLFGIGFMKDVLVIKNNVNEMSIYNKRGKQLGNIHNITSNSNLDMSNVLPYLYPFLSSGYKLNAYILYTQIKGIYLWTDETIQKALSYMNKKEIKNSTDYIKANNIYPYGILRIYNNTSKKYENEYTYLNEENFFSYNETSFVIDISSSIKINEVDRIQNARFIRLKESKRVFAYLDFQSFAVAVTKTKSLICGEKENRANRLIGVFYVESLKEKIIDYTEYLHFNAKGLISHISLSNKHYGYVFTPNKRTNIDSTIYRGVDIVFSQIIKGEDFEFLFHLTHYSNIKGLTLKSEFSFTVNFLPEEVFFVGKFNYTGLINIKAEPFYVCKSRFEIVRDKLGYLISDYNYSFSLNKGLKNVGMYKTKWSVIWMQLFIPTASDLSVIASKLFEIATTPIDFDIRMPIDYAYVDDVLPGKIKKISDKGMGLPSISQKEIKPQFLGLTKKKKESDKICNSPFMVLDREGFEYNIEFNDNLLIGNYLTSFKEHFYGGEMTIVSSMFVKNRYASDLELFSNKLIDTLEKKVKAPIDNNYDVDNFKLTKDDFGGQISDDSFRAVKNQINQLETNASEAREIDNMTIDEYKKTHPELKKEMNQYLDNLSTPEDSYVWENNPARKPIDGILFKKVKIKQTFNVQLRNEEQNNV